MRGFIFILLFSFLLAVSADVIFTSERCNRVTYGLRTVNGDPSRYKQCGPSGRVWIVPCAPQMTFDPEDRVCKERLDVKVLKPMRKYEVPKSIITTPAPLPSLYPVSAEAATPASAPEEFVFSTVRPKSRKPKSRTRAKTRKMTATTTPMPSTEQTTPKIVIFASKKSDERREKTSQPFTRPGRVRTTTQMPVPVTHATRFVVSGQMNTVAPVKESQGMPVTLAPFEKTERRGETFPVDEMTTMTPEYTVRYNGKSMTENEFLNQLLHIVQHQKAVSERQQQEKFDRMEQERLRQEQAERALELERRRQLEVAERARQAELERQAEIYAEQERLAMERERELERIRQEERKREMERIRQEEIAMEVARMRELERLQQERQLKNERIRQEQEAARQRELRRLEEERARELERVRQEEADRQRQVERLRKEKEAERQRQAEKLRQEKEAEIQRQQAEAERQRQVEAEMQRQEEEDRKRKALEKEMEERQKAIREEEQRRKAEEERRKQLESLERDRMQEQMRKASEERSRLEAMEREREMMMQIIESERERAEMEATTPVTTLRPIYRPPISEYQPPDVESQMIRFTTQAPEWATKWNTVTVEEETSNVPVVHQGLCQLNGECALKYDADSFCAHPSNPSMYLQCAPLYGRLGRWTERQCPDTLVFVVEVGRCEKGSDGRKPYDPDNRVVIPRLPSETSFVEWKGNRVIDNLPNQVVPRVYPPVPETHQPQIYNTIDEFPKDLLPKMPEVSPAETYAQQYQNHIHGSVISGSHSQNSITPTISPIPIIPSSYQITQSSAEDNSLKSEIDLSHIHPLFPRVQPDFLSRLLPALNLKLQDDATSRQSLGSVVKPVLKKLALNQTEQFLDRLLADQVHDASLRKEIIDRLKSS